MIYELSVIAPCYNEEGNLRELVTACRLLRDKGHCGRNRPCQRWEYGLHGPLVDQLAAEHSNIVASTTR